MVGQVPWVTLDCKPYGIRWDQVSFPLLSKRAPNLPRSAVQGGSSAIYSSRLPFL